MAFLDEIMGCFDGELSPSDKFTVVGFRYAYFECVASIVKYSPCEVELCLKKRRVKVIGEELYIKKFCGGDAIICGKIKSVSAE